MCKFEDAEERAAFRSTICSASAAPQNQANCTRPKICVVGNVQHSIPHHAPQLRIRTPAKSIAPCRMQLQKKVHGGLRDATRGWC